jgi:hypothetical protein
MATVQRIAQIFGAVFIIVGLLGFAYSRNMDTGMILGLFMVNAVHNVVHLAFGIWGLMAAKTFSGAKMYGLAGGVIYLVLAICGYFVPAGFGLVPLGGNDIYLHAGLGIILLGAGASAKAA